VRVFLPEEERDVPVVRTGEQNMKAKRSTHGVLSAAVGNRSNFEDVR
jgi:hypothetical protein